MYMYIYTGYIGLINHLQPGMRIQVISLPLSLSLDFSLAQGFANIQRIAFHSAQHNTK